VFLHGDITALTSCKDYEYESTVGIIELFDFKSGVKATKVNSYYLGW